MGDASGRSKSATTALAVGVAIAVASGFFAITTFVPQPAQATPAFAQQTGKPCGACHTNPAGGGKLTAAGKKFQASH